ncbi:unnamed protein product [Moneuplotes crassus]|uniref:Uncharacterized protein n=1 Tax=Euplotes crassus TaxID=5936 RepID=A0AAD1USG6_EUPCR|nr:unnamed protein product [Moneuplotes crassus]
MSIFQLLNQFYSSMLYRSGECCIYNLQKSEDGQLSSPFGCRKKKHDIELMYCIIKNPNGGDQVLGKFCQTCYNKEFQGEIKQLISTLKSMEGSKIIKVSLYNEKVFTLQHRVIRHCKNKLRSSLACKNNKRKRKYQDILLEILEILNANSNHYRENYPDISGSNDYQARLEELLSTVKKLPKIEDYDDNVYFSTNAKGLTDFSDKVPYFDSKNDYIESEIVQRPEDFESPSKVIFEPADQSHSTDTYGGKSNSVIIEEEKGDVHPLKGLVRTSTIRKLVPTDLPYKQNFIDDSCKKLAQDFKSEIDYLVSNVSVEESTRVTEESTRSPILLIPEDLKLLDYNSMYPSLRFLVNNSLPNKKPEKSPKTIINNFMALFNKDLKESILSCLPKVDKHQHHPKFFLGILQKNPVIRNIVNLSLVAETCRAMKMPKKVFETLAFHLPTLEKDFDKIIEIISDFLRESLKAVKSLNANISKDCTPFKFIGGKRLKIEEGKYFCPTIEIFSAKTMTPEEVEQSEGTFIYRSEDSCYRTSFDYDDLNVSSLDQSTTSSPNRGKRSESQFYWEYPFALYDIREE